jgi:pyruvate dehydrogenase E1 component alpha subunit
MRSINEENLIRFYTEMVTIRRFEERISKSYYQGLVPCWVHLSIGQEAIPVGVCSNLQQKDYVIQTHRGHGVAIAKGIPLDIMTAEIYGKKTGCCRGKGGSMHLTYIDKGLLCSVAIVGTGISLATGVGLSIRNRKTDQVVVSFFGEGASNTGDFHEGLNLASIWKLPVIFVCANNQYAVSGHVSRTTSVRDISKRATAYNMPGVTIDGNDVIEVSNAAEEAIRRAKEGNGPTLIECKTYRISGHHAGDPATYRSKEEVNRWKEKDPINRLRRKLHEQNILDESQLRNIEVDIKMKIEHAMKFAEESEYPPSEDITDEIFYRAETA